MALIIFSFSRFFSQVKYIFSDKTGTLTRNEMVFKQMSVGGILYQPAENLKDTLLIQVAEF